MIALDGYGGRNRFRVPFASSDIQAMLGPKQLVVRRPFTINTKRPASVATLAPMTESNLRFCPNCGQDVGLTDRFCSRCGVALTRASEFSQNSDANQPAATKEVTSRPLDHSASSRMQQPTRSETGVGQRILIGLLTLTLIAGAISWLSHSRSSNVKSSVETTSTSPATRPPNPTLSPQQFASVLEQTTRNALPEFTTTLEGWDIYRDKVFGELICLTVSYTNVGRVDGMPPAYQFSLVAPSGRVLLLGLRSDANPLVDLQQVIPGTVGTFQTCFASNKERGKFTLRRSDLVFGHDGAWEIPVSTK